MTFFSLVRFAALAFVVLLGASVLTVQDTQGNEFHTSSGCNSSKRVLKDNADCLTASWNNSTKWVTSIPEEVLAPQPNWRVEITNNCIAHAKLVANVSLKHGSNRHFVVDTGNVDRSEAGNHVSSVTCCMGQKQICHRKQVEAVNGEILHYTGVGTTTETVDVSTHRKRFDYCAKRPNFVYCLVDPEGDAFTRPFNCGGHYCTAGDCQWHWERSEAHTGGTCLDTDAGDDFSMSIDAADGTSQRCTVEVQCETGEVVDNQAVHEDNSFTAQVWDFDDLHNCGGTLQVGAC